MSPKPTELPARVETLRTELRTALSEGRSTSRELSQALGVSEREVLEHLPHLARSLSHTGERLAIEPSSCLGCGFEFEERTRVKRPGRCPACKSTRISPPRFGIVPA
jgi:transcriptional regulator